MLLLIFDKENAHLNRDLKLRILTFLCKRAISIEVRLHGIDKNNYHSTRILETKSIAKL